MAFDPKILMSFADLQTLIDTESFTQKNAFPTTSLKRADKLEVIDALNINLVKIDPLTDNQLVAREFIEAIVVGDNPPTAPTVIATNITDTTVSISWSGATDDIGISFYNIWVQAPGDNPVFVDQVISTQSTYLFSPLLSGTDYRFYVITQDTAGQLSPATGYVDVTTTTSSSPSLLIRAISVTDSPEEKTIQVYNATQTQEIVIKFTLIAQTITSLPRVRDYYSTNIDIVSPLTNIGDNIEYTKTIGLNSDVSIPINLWYTYAGEDMTIQCEVISAVDPLPPSSINALLTSFSLKWITARSTLSQMDLYVTTTVTQLINWEVNITNTTGGPHYTYYSLGPGEIILDETDGVPFTGYTNTQVIAGESTRIGQFTEASFQDTNTIATANISYSGAGQTIPEDMPVNLGAQLFATRMNASQFVDNNYYKDFIVNNISGTQVVSIKLTVISVNIITPGAYVELAGTSVQYIKDFIWLDIDVIVNDTISLAIKIVNGAIGDTARIGCEVKYWTVDFPPVNSAPGTPYFIDLG